MYQPLADLLRPQTLDEVFGQEHILGKGAVLRRLEYPSVPLQDLRKTEKVIPYT